VKPLVSVIVPAYNAEAVLPQALASVLAQSFTEWEALVVDDGSLDGTREVAHAVDDRRIRYFRLERNRGRGFARQYALDRAEGVYCCMLDADDWMYPSRIAEQVEALEACQSLSFVSAGMAIADKGGSLRGVRGVPRRLLCYAPTRELRRPGAPFAASMFRASVARQYGFDAGFTVAEDADFLMRVQREKGFAVLPKVLYTYNEYGSLTIEKLLLSAAAHRRICARHWRREPLAVARGIIESAGRSVAYRCAFALGAGDYLIMRRSRKPSAQEMAGYSEARRRVAQFAARHFGSLASNRDRHREPLFTPAGA
jgi:glycosyltransferase involved in cell wall biosynthesis